MSRPPQQPISPILARLLGLLRPRTLGSPALDAVFSILALIALGTLWLLRYPAGVDLPQHANILRILADYSDPATGYAAFYERQFATPYFVTYLVALPFAKVFSPLVAVKVILSIAAVATPWTMIRWLRSQGGEPWWGLFGFPITFGFGYHWGLLSWVFVIPMVLAYLASFDRLAQAPTWRGAGKAALWAMLLYLTHGIAFALAMLSAAGQTVWRFVQRPALRPLLIIGAHVVPAVVASLAWQSKSNVPRLTEITEWPPSNDRFAALLSSEFSTWPSFATIAVGAGILLVMLIASRPALAAGPARLVPLIVSAIGFVTLPEMIATTWLVGMRLSMFVHVFAAGAFNPGVTGRRRTGMHVVTTLVVLGCLVGHAVRMWIFNGEMAGLTTIIATIPPHVDVRGLLTDTDNRSRVFGAVMGQTPAWVTASNRGFLENDSGGYYQIPIQRPHNKPWIPQSAYRWFVARGSSGIERRVKSLVGPVRVVERADNWWLFESERPPLSTGGLEVVRYIQEWANLEVDSSLEHRPLQVAGTSYSSGFAAHALSRIQVRVKANGSRLRGLVGVDDAASNPTELVFKIRGTDGHPLFESPPVTNRKAAVPFDVPLGGRRDLILSAEVTPRHGGNNGAHADWLALQVVE